LVAALAFSLALSWSPVARGGPLGVGAGVRGELRSYRSLSGEKLRLFLAWPKDRDPATLPLLIYLHGDFVGLRRLDLHLARRLAGIGFLVAAPEFRGERRGRSELGGGEVEDVLRLISRLVGGRRERPLYLVGYSRGALVALKIMERLPGIGGAAVIAPPWDLSSVARLSREDFRRRWLGEMLGCDVEECPKLYRQRSFSGKLATPGVRVLILAGGEDRIVPPGEAVRLAELLEEAGAVVSLRLFDRLDHEAVLAAALGPVVDFLAETTQED